MCLGVPAKIIKINGDSAVADVMGVSCQINIAFVKNLKEGDFVMLHAGSAIAKISEQEAELTISIMQELGEMNDK